MKYYPQLSPTLIKICFLGNGNNLKLIGRRGWDTNSCGVLQAETVYNDVGTRR